MVRFALAVTGVMLLLTAIATVWIASTEAPVGREFLRREDLTAIGLSPATFHMRRDILPKQVTTQEFVSELEGLPVTIRAETRLGAAREAFDRVRVREQAAAADPARPREWTHGVKLEKFDQGRVEQCASVRTFPGSPAGTVDVQVWLQDGNNAFHCRVSEKDVKPEEMDARRDWCERQARTIAHIMMGAVREMQSPP